MFVESINEYSPVDLILEISRFGGPPRQNRISSRGSFDGPTTQRKVPGGIDVFSYLERASSGASNGGSHTSITFVVAEQWRGQNSIAKCGSIFVLFWRLL